MATNFYALTSKATSGTTGTGLDQLVDFIEHDNRLSGTISDKDLREGMAAADGILGMIVEAVEKTGAGDAGRFNVDDIRAINEYIRANHYEEFVKLHGDDEGREETGYHTVQQDGGSTHYGGKNLIDNQLDSLLHIGFKIRGNNILNEDGDTNASLQKLARTLTDFWTDRSTTNTGLDRITDGILANKGLVRDKAVSNADRYAGAEAADGMNQIILKAIEATGAAQDSRISADDIRAMNAWIRENMAEEFASFYGEAASGKTPETGFLRVENEGAYVNYFGQNSVDVVANGLYHLGFDIEGDALVKDGVAAAASVQEVAEYLNYFLIDHGTTGTGLDELVQIAKSDFGLAAHTSAAAINEGAAAADAINHLIVKAIEAQGLATDGVLDIGDVKAINEYIRENHFEEFVKLHGDDEDGVETGFHQIVNNGAGEIRDAVKTGCNTYAGVKVVDTIMDGLYHIGFEIVGDKFSNEDGTAMHNVGDVASWLNEFYLQKEIKFGSEDGDRMKGLNTDDVLYGRGGADKIFGHDGNDFIDAGTGNDFVQGGNGTDTIFGGNGTDKIYGGNGADVLMDGGHRDWVHGGKGDDVFLTHADSYKDNFYGEAGADTFMFWVDGKMHRDTIHKFSSKEGDKIVLGGDVAEFTLKRAKRGFVEIKLWDEDGNSLGMLRAKGVTASDIEIDSNAFAAYQSEMLMMGVEVEAELTLIEEQPILEEVLEASAEEAAPAINEADLPDVIAPTPIDLSEATITFSIF